MKPILTLAILLFTTLSFAQNSGMIVGKILDKEFAENPLVLANVQVKGTSIKASTDQAGLFVIEHLAYGDYTLVCSFTGYETREVKVKVEDNTPNITLSLRASGLSMADLAALTSVAEKEEKAPTTVSLK